MGVISMLRGGSHNRIFFICTKTGVISKQIKVSILVIAGSGAKNEIFLEGIHQVQRSSSVLHNRRKHCINLVLY